MGPLEEFFISPIMEKTGYNPVNTIVYAAIALLAVYVIFKILKKTGIKINNDFFWGVLSFVLFGSTMRAVTDSVDGGVFTGVTPIHEGILNSGILDYGFLTVTPGIYILVAGILLATIAVLHCIKRMELLPYIGFALFIPFFLLLIPFMQHVEYAIPVLILTAIPAYFIWKRYGAVASAVVAGHAMDGAATFIILDIFSSAVGKNYFEQHVLSRFVGELLDTYFLFYMVKVAIASMAVYLVEKENLKPDERIYFYLVIAIIGLAPGIRSILRMVCGT